MKQRLESLKSMEKIMILISNDIRYRHSVLQEAFLNSAKKTDKPFAEWLRLLADRLYGGDFYDIWCLSLSELDKSTCLTEGDIEELKPIGQTLGYLDISAQEMGLRLEIDNLHEKILKLDENLYDRMKVSVVAGTVLGILTVVVLV